MAENENYIGRWWNQDNGKVLCNLCPRNCMLSDGQRGFCFVRQNINNQICLTTYGKSTGFCIDPIEKKPLNHFLPGTPVLSFGTAGCNLGCKFCQNWDISKSKEVEILSAHASPEQIVLEAKKRDCRSIAFTYNDPIIWAEYAIDTARIAQQEKIKTVAVTSGYISKEARTEFFKHIDATNVDLKSFSEAFYQNITLSHLAPVLETLVWLKNESSTWFEITNLIIPEENDSEDELNRMCDWILKNLGDSIPLHFTAFHPDYKMLNRPPTPPETLIRARKNAISRGLKFVYTGNIHDPGGQATYCPKCKTPLIERERYNLLSYSIHDGACKSCGTKIPGIFENNPGNWGNKREPLELSKDATKVKISSAAKGQSNNSTSIKFTPRTDFSNAEIDSLLSYTRALIEATVNKTACPISLPENLKIAPAYGAFVTLHRGSSLRACIGNWGNPAGDTLENILREATISTATSDPRFPSIKEIELPFLSLEVSIMYDPEIIEAKGVNRLTSFLVGTHGLVTLSPRGRGLLLPNVATENNWDNKTFLEQTCRKAGLPLDSWMNDDVEILIFKTVKLEGSPKSSELSLDLINADILTQLFQFADKLSESGEDLNKPLTDLSLNFNSQLGIRLETSSGLAVTKFKRGSNLKTLLQDAIELLKSTVKNQPNHTFDITQINVLTEGVQIYPTDYPNRLLTISNSAILVQGKNGSELIVPEQFKTRNPILEALTSINENIVSWKNGSIKITSFETRGMKKEIKIQEDLTRAPAFAGRFYPNDPHEIEHTISGLISKVSPSLKFYPGLILPHAGWQYCGSVIAKSIDHSYIPEEVIIIGPKHTNLGERLSIASQSSWSFPGFGAPVSKEIREYLSKAIPNLKCDSLAHQQEHGSEVIIPFLKYRQPNLTILPIAIGQCSADEIILIARALAELFNEHHKRTGRPFLMIASSDMNHFATEEEGRRRDNLALQAIEAGSPEKLLEICHKEDISMCGAIPAAIVMQALRFLFGDTRGEILAYQTSADVNGDKSSVVGYAGVRFFPITN